MQHDLEKFFILAEVGSFTKAGARLGLSQPALSMAIQKLERTMGMPLIVRDATGIRLTDAGQEVYISARRLRLELNNLQQRLEEMQNKNLSRPIRLGMIDSIGTLLFSHGFRPSGPLEVIIDNSTRLRQDVRLSHLEIAFITAPFAAVEEELLVSPIGKETFVLVAAPQIVEQVRRQLLNQKKLHQFLTYNMDSTTYALLERMLEEKKIEVQVDFYSTNPELLRLLALGGRGPTLLPRILVAPDIKNKKLVEISELSFSRRISLIQRQDASNSPRLQAIIETIKNLLSK